MKKSWLITVSLAVVIMTATVAFAGCSGGSTSPIPGSLPSDLRVNLSSQQEGLWASGSGKVSVVPDCFHLGVCPFYPFFVIFILTYIH